MVDTHTFKIMAMDDNGNVIAEMEFQGPSDFNLIIEVEAPALPERSPLHPDALNLDDLEVGLSIVRHNIHGRITNVVGIVNGEAFLRGEKYQSLWDDPSALMIPVVAFYRGNLCFEDWYLSDMGVVPYVGNNGPFWNDQNYTLAVR